MMDRGKKLDWVTHLIAAAVRIAGSKRRLALELGISPASLTQYESGSLPSARNLDLLFNYLGLDLGRALSRGQAAENTIAEQVAEQQAAYRTRGESRCVMKEGEKYTIQCIKRSKNGKLLLELGEML